MNPGRTTPQVGWGREGRRERERGAYSDRPPVAHVQLPPPRSSVSSLSAYRLIVGISVARPSPGSCPATTLAYQGRRPPLDPPTLDAHTRD